MSSPQGTRKPNPEDLLSARQVYAVAQGGVSLETIRRWMRKGAIPTVWIKAPDGSTRRLLRVRRKDAESLLGAD